GGRAAQDRGLDGVGALRPRPTHLPDLLERQRGLIEQDQMRAIPAHRADHAGSPSRARRSPSERDPTRKSLSRLLAPLTSATAETGTPNARPSSTATARFASPPIGAAATRTRRAAPCQPTPALCPARASAGAGSSEGSGGGAVVARPGLVREILLEEPLIHLHGRAERFGELAAHPPERRHLRLHRGLGRPRRLDQLLRLQLGLADE